MAVSRCPWLDVSKQDYVHYHDTEWGVPVFDDATLFEYIVLESAQAGLSWYTILRKREGYRLAFAGFNANEIAAFGCDDVVRLLNDPGIVRNRLKVEATINNARRFLEVQATHGTFAKYLWQFVDGRPVVSKFKELSDYPARTKLSDVIAGDLKRRGFKFMGTTTCYAFMQAVGMVNDHSLNCFRRKEILDSHPPHFVGESIR